MWLLYTGAGLVGICFLVVAWGFITSPHRYEYLHSLSLSEWRDTRRIRDEMKSIVGKDPNLANTYVALERLEEEGLVESHTRELDAEEAKRRNRPRVVEFKLTENGKRKRNELFDETMKRLREGSDTPKVRAVAQKLHDGLKSGEIKLK